MSLRMIYLRMLYSIYCLLIFSVTHAQQTNPAAHWTFDVISNRKVSDIAGKMADVINGYVNYRDGVAGNGLKFDTKSTFIVRKDNIPDLSGGQFTFEAWIAQQAYPLNWAPIFEQYDDKHGFFFGVDSDGRFGLHILCNGIWYNCNVRSAYPGYETFHSWNSDRRKWELHDREEKPPEPLKGKAQPFLPLLKWTHLAAVFDKENGMTLYYNGKRAVHLTYNGPFYQSDTPLYIGRSPHEVYPAHTERFYGTQPLAPSFDGLMDELKIYNRALTNDEIDSVFRKVNPKVAQPLNFRKIPTGPKGPGKFGAYYTFLKYDDDFDRHFRMKVDPDVVVMFDKFPFKLVCWHGLNYYPVWYSENDIGISHEAVETWGHLGTHEAMMDKQVRYANVRILENTDARVVLHYRHAMNNMEYELIHEDSVSGWHDWCDEILTIYPDGVAARNLVHWCSYLDLKGKKDKIYVENFVEEVDATGQLLEKLPNSVNESEDEESEGGNSKLDYIPQPHSYEQDNFIVPIGKTPSDILHKEGGIHANMNGDESKYTWEYSGRPRGRRVKNPNIVVYNIKAESKPFMIVPPEASEHFFEGNGKPWPNCYYWWDHWPVAQIKSDGKQIHMVNGRPSSSCIGATAFKLDTTVFKHTDKSISVYSLLGMAMNKRAGDLLPLARSWVYAPSIRIIDGHYKSGGYSREERCYTLISQSLNDKDLMIEIEGSQNNPIINIPLVIKDWGDYDAVCRINGNEINDYSIIRFGHINNLTGKSDLIVFIEMQSTKKTRIDISRK